MPSGRSKYPYRPVLTRTGHFLRFHWTSPQNVVSFGMNDTHLPVSSVESTVFVYVMEGAVGSADFAGVVCEDDYVILEVYDSNGDFVEFEGKARWLEEFCKEQGLGYQKIQHDYRFPINTKVPE